MTRIAKVMTTDNEFLEVYQELKQDIFTVIEAVVVGKKQLDSTEKIIDSIIRKHLEIHDETAELETNSLFNV